MNTNPTFDSRNYGYSKLSLLVRDVPQLEVNEVTSVSGLTTLNVRAAAAQATQAPASARSSPRAASRGTIAS